MFGGGGLQHLLVEVDFVLNVLRRLDLVFVGRLEIPELPAVAQID
ncbi:MAG: hypothetical protein U0521_29825 [Anaerolineae bacterium]